MIASRNWLSLCYNIVSPPILILLENFFQMFCSFDNSNFIIVWLRVKSFKITFRVIYEALVVPFVSDADSTYSSTSEFFINDVLILLWSHNTIWDGSVNVPTSMLTNEYVVLYRIVCHNIWPISHIHLSPKLDLHFSMLLSLVLIFVFLLSFFILCHHLLKFQETSLDLSYFPW